MFFQKFFLYTIFLIFLFFIFYIFDDEFEVREEIDTPIYIEPIVIPSLVKEDSDIEILEKLKDATRETFNNSNYYDDKVADEVLGILKEVVKNKNIKKDISFKYENRVKKELKKTKIASGKKKLEYKKRVEKRALKNKNIKKDISFKYENRVKKELKKTKIASGKKKLEYKKRVEKRVVKNKNIKKYISFKYENRVEKELKKIKIASGKKKLEYKKIVVEQSKIDRLSKENLEEDIKLEDLPLVETLGVVEVSEPFTLN